MIVIFIRDLKIFVHSTALEQDVVLIHVTDIKHFYKMVLVKIAILSLMITQKRINGAQHIFVL